MFCPLFLSVRCHWPLFLWFSKENMGPFWPVLSPVPRYSDPGFPSLIQRQSSLYFSPSPPYQSPPEPKAVGGLNTCPGLLGTTPPRHRERGWEAVNSPLPWCMRLSCCQKLNVVLVHFCVCMRINFSALMMEGTHCPAPPNPHVLMTESQLKIQIQGSFWKRQWWFLLPFIPRPSLGCQHFNLLPGSGGWGGGNLIYCN